MLAPPSQTASIRRGGQRRHLLNTLQPLKFTPLTADASAEERSRPKQLSGQESKTALRAVPGQNGLRTPPSSSSSGVKTLKTTRDSVAARPLDNPPPPKPPRKVSAAICCNGNNKSPNSPVGGGIPSPVLNKNLQCGNTVRRSPTKAHAVVNVNNRRSYTKKSPNGNRSFLVKTSPNGNTGIPSFAALDNSPAARRVASRRGSPQYEKPPKPSRRSSLQQATPPSAPQNLPTSSSAPRLAAPRKSPQPAKTPLDVPPHIHHPCFSHILPSKSSTRHDAGFPQKGAIRREDAGAPRPENTANVVSADGSTDNNGDASHCQGSGSGSGRDESFPQFPAGRRAIRGGGEGDDATLRNVPDDSQETTVTLNVSDTIRRRIPRASLNLDEATFDGISKQEAKESDAADPAEVAISSKQRRVTIAEFGAHLPGKEQGDEIGSSSSINQENVLEWTSLNNIGPEIPSRAINNSALGAPSAMGNKQHRALGAEDEFDAALNSSHSGTRRKRKLRSAAVHSKHAGTCGEGAEDEADKKPRGGEKVQKVQREKHRHAPPPAPSPAPASPTNSSGNPSEVSDNHEILPPPERRAENEHGARNDPSYQAAGLGRGGQRRVGEEIIAMLQEAQVDVSLSTHMLQPCQDESSCDTDSDSCLENTQSGGESIRDTSSAHESSGELSSVPTPPKAGKPRKDGFSRRQRKTREKPRECESSEILEAVNEYEEVEELAPCLRSPKRIAKDDHMQRAGKASEKRRKRESVELVISEIYQEEDSFCTSYLEEEFSGDIIKPHHCSPHHCKPHHHKPHHHKPHRYKTHQSKLHHCSPHQSKPYHCSPYQYKPHATSHTIAVHTATPLKPTPEQATCYKPYHCSTVTSQVMPTQWRFSVQLTDLPLPSASPRAETSAEQEPLSSAKR
ncbi:hypothetical protein C7M84_002551 [Penaeus vannamei]|uniref:Uncharacterized protein n=1 Tax=Penaeus vannamei TaxID=6689 RepID=A0A3R7MD79_PENVA|nr:hypothetical protein C7M84_002551 [Penaeus vannamei]